MFVTDNHDSFHFWWKENLIKHQKVSKYYDQDCRNKLPKAIEDINEERLWSNFNINKAIAIARNEILHKNPTESDEKLPLIVPLSTTFQDLIHIVSKILDT